jgi:hypothetical protein
MRAAHKTEAVMALALAVAACSQGSTNTAPTATTVATPSATEIYGLRERCAKDAAEAVKSMHDKPNSPNHISTYQNHYDLTTNDCYLLNYTVDSGSKGSISTSDILSSVSDGRVIGVFLETKPGEIRTCEVLGRQCNSEDEFDAMAKPYTGAH